MTSTLPSNLHAEIALDRGRLSHDSPERTSARNISQARGMTGDPHSRVQSLHGVIIETHPGPGHHAHGHSPLSAQSGVITADPYAERGRGQDGTLSGAELAAALDQEEEDDEELIRMPQPMMSGGQGYGQQNMPSSGDYFSQDHHGHEQRPFASRQGSLNSSAPQQQGTNGNPRSILRNGSEALAPPTHSGGYNNMPGSAPPTQQSFPDKPRFALSDSGPMSAPPSPGGHGQGQMQSGPGAHPAIRRAVSDTHPHSEPSSPGLGVTPPMRRASGNSQPTTPKYNTFEEMGIQGNQAEKDKDCVIM